MKDEWLLNESPDFYINDLRNTLQNFLTDLSRIPFIRDNPLFKTFLEIDAHYVEDEFGQNGRHFQSMGPGGLQAMNLAAQSIGGGRSSVLNPFTTSLT